MKRVLIAPLDWGLGHATRCVPIIRLLLQHQCHVVLAGSGQSLELLKKEFPALESYQLPGYNPKYPLRGSMVWAMALQLPHFINVIREEHLVLEEIVHNNNIGIVISDNRYGCWSANAFSVFITHQSNIMMPKRFGWLSGWVKKRNRTFIERFDKCWIPDQTNSFLSGDLSMLENFNLSIPAEHIGHLSRFRRAENKPARYDVAVILSGPEPQRSVLENILLSQLKYSGLRYYLVRGIPSGNRSDGQCCDFMNSSELQQLFEISSVVIARSGYSTVMDLAVIRKNAILIPTPGQTEQQYLADRLKRHKIVFAMAQHNFNLNLALGESKKYKGFTEMEFSDNLLRDAVQTLLKP